MCVACVLKSYCASFVVTPVNLSRRRRARNEVGEEKNGAPMIEFLFPVLQ